MMQKAIFSGAVPAGPLVGRNGMSKYNNVDLLMLPAIVAVDNIEAGVTSKANLSSIKRGQEHHEEKIGPKISPDSPKRKSGPVLEIVSDSFKDYLLRSHSNRILLWVAGIAILVQITVFKALYPYAGFINGDSYVYLQSAFMNSSVNIYPIGYSKFLRLFSVFTNSDTALVAFQYLAIQLSALWLLFTLFKLYAPGSVTKWLMFIFVVFNPVFLYLSNYVSSDALFLALSLTWFTILIQMLQRPVIQLVISQVIILFLAFTVRYNALYYPLIASLALLLSRYPVRIKLAGIGASILVIGLFMQFTAGQYKQLTGSRQFTPFTGWQIANNAVYAYRYVDRRHLKGTPRKFSQLDRMVRNYFDTTPALSFAANEMLSVSTMYMWDPKSPLQIFMKQQCKKDTSASVLKKWATMAPLYQEYGYYLIHAYPMTYLQHYLIPNSLKYYVPPGEFLETYNMGRDTVARIAQGWFNYKTNKVRTAFNDLNVSSLGFLPILAGIMNVTFLLGSICFLLLKKQNNRQLPWSPLLLAFVLWVVNFVFSVFASPITLRYQLFAILIFSSFALLLIDHLYKTAFTNSIYPNRLDA